MAAPPFERAVVIGTTSSGKSTLARRLAEKLDFALIELDALHWEPNWRPAEEEVLRARVQEALRADRWVSAGNYHQVRDLIWPRAQAAIWLDYSFPRVFWQLTRRTIHRLVTQEVLWGTNVERLWTHLKLWSDESLYHWLFKTYWRRKREIPQLLAEPRHRHLHLYRFKSPAQTDAWLASL